MIKVEINGDHATAFGPFPSGFFSAITSLSGRKKWDSSKRVRFEASRSNIDILKSMDIEITFDDKSKRLNKFDQLAKMATQYDTFAEVKKEPKRNPRDLFASYRAGEVKEAPSKAVGLPVWFEPKTQPKDHQRQSLGMSWDREVYAWFLEMGLGKTWICINNIAMLRQKRGLIGAIVMAPKGILKQWMSDEVPKHYPRGKLPIMQMCEKAKLDKFKYKGYCNILFVGTDEVRTDKARPKILEFIKRCGGNVLFAVDESHKIKTPKQKSQRTAAAIEFGHLCKWRRIMTGTPIGKNLLDGFSQFYFLDPDIFGHRYVTSFKSEYCIMGGFEMREVVAHKNVDQFYNIMSRHAFRMTKKEALDLPEKIYMTREYEMPSALLKRYNALKKAIIEELEGNSIKVPANAATKVLALQQMTCGFYRDDDDNIVDVDDSRLSELMDVIDQTRGPVLIWCAFKHDILKIQAKLQKAFSKKDVVLYYGDVKPKDRDKAVDQFVSGGARFFVGTPASGGAGLNLQGDCQTVIYYSQTFDALVRWQSEDRVHRMGMKGAVTYIDLVAAKSVDDKIRRNLLAKKGLADLTLDELRQMVKAD